MRCGWPRATNKAMGSDATTVGQALDAAAAVLSDAGVPEARHDVLRLWADLNRQSPAEVLLHRDRMMSPADSVRLSGALQRRVEGEPLAYVTGWAGFRHLTLIADRRALIPRPETEGLVDAALEMVSTGLAADIGTGTGAIALSLRAEAAFDEVFGVDLSPDALELARNNGVLTGLPVTWIEGDLVAPLAGRQVDLLVSNPPYLTTAEYDSLDRSVRDYEPGMALVGGEDGQRLLRRLIREGLAAVKPGGWLALEVDCRRADDTARVAAATGWTNVTIRDDLFGRARYVLAQRGRSA